MFANFLIGLREGLEAALVVGILIAYLVKTGRSDRVHHVWWGIAAAVTLSLGFGALLTFTSADMGFRAQEAFGGFMSIIAVGLVTWMVFWMKAAARDLKGELHSRLDDAITAGGIAIAIVAFVAVAREGLETALFLWAAVNATGQTAVPIAGALLGLGVAVFLGWLIYRGALRLNLATFFRWTGAGLIIVAAGVLAYGVHDLQEAAILPGLNNFAFDVSAQVPSSSWYGTLLKGTINFSPQTTWLQAIVWIAYLVPTMFLYLRRPKPRVVSVRETASTPAAPVPTPK